MDQDYMQSVLKHIIVTIKGAEEPEVPEQGEENGDEGLSPWNGEDEKAFMSWTEKFHHVHVERGRQDLAQHPQEGPEPQR